jgi:ribosome maturation factor RimP
MKSKIEELVSILEGLSNGELHASVARKKIEALSIDNLENVHSNLSHYLDDEDIREKGYVTSN